MRNVPWIAIVLMTACGGAPRPSPCPACATVEPPVASPTPAPPPAATPAAAPAPSPPPVATPGGTIAVAVLPTRALIERTDGAQLVNCDLLLTNGTGLAWSLTAIEVSAFDRAGQLTWRKRIDDNGVSPAITTVPERALAAGAELLLLNPVHTFPLDLDLARLRFALTFAAPDSAAAEPARAPITVSAEVAPVAYVEHATLRLPVAGRVLVWDGHDFLAHHRRWDYRFAPIRAFGFDSNAGRYAYDLVVVDAAGAMSSGDPDDNASWPGFGQPVRAPADGVVVRAVTGEPDDRSFDMGRLHDDLLVVYGNHVLIDHGHGEVSMLAHLKQGSVTVQVGDRVTAGQPIAQIGASGSAMFPHLHYQLQTTADGHAEGVPSYFHDFARVRGARRLAVKRGAIDSGEILDSAAPRRWR